MKKIFLMAVLSIALINCSSYDNNNEPFVSQDLEFEVLVLSTRFMLGPPVFIANESVLYTQEDLENLIEGTPNSESPLGNFDFDNYQMVAVCGEAIPNGSIYYEIESIIENEYDITINYEYHINPYVGSYDFIYQPYFYLKMPKSDKPVLFEMEEVLID